MNAYIENVKSIATEPDPDSVVHDTCKRFGTIANPLEVHHQKARETVELLGSLDADADMLNVAVLRQSENRTAIDSERVEKVFGSSAKTLFEGAGKLDQISPTTIDGTPRKPNFWRSVSVNRMIVAMVDDPRVVIVRLAEQLILLRAAREFDEDEKRAIAEHTMALFAPLANRLGVWRLKWQLEDLSLKYLDRPTFDKLARLLLERRVEREQYINGFVQQLRVLMDKSNIQATVNGRAKHIFGIWRKLNQKGVGFEKIFDVRAVRILVDDISTCYEALGAVHAKWQRISEEFDDYIAVPKANGYQSIHTAVIGPQDKVVEVQIRTWEMHHEAEIGLSAHWKYKENRKSGSLQDDKVRWLRQLLEWRDELFRQSTSEKSQQEYAQEESIYVFTPAGNVVELPKLATPIDFAYFIHTEVGHRCRGAKVNGRIVPLTYQLQTGDWVEIRTVKSGGPSRDWLNLQRGFIVTSRARTRIARWFKLEEYGRYQAAGKAALEKEITRRGIVQVNFDKLASENGYRRPLDLYAAIGMKELKVSHALECLDKKLEADEAFEDFSETSRRPEPASVASVSILGSGSMLTNLASCCGPLPGDDVVGYVTVARGITVHKRTCGNLTRMLEKHSDRRLEVDWGGTDKQAWPTEIEITAEGRSNLLQEITTVVADSGSPLLSVNSTTLRKSQVGKILITVEVHSGKELSSIIASLRKIENIYRVRRLAH